MVPAERKIIMKFDKSCCFCGREVEGIGNNPWPVIKRKSAACCNWCDMNIVLVARLRMFSELEKMEE